MGTGDGNGREPGFFEVIGRRRSVRVFLDEPIGEPVLRRVLAAASEAPSAGNLQAYEIHVVRDPTRRRQLADAALAQDFIAQAPVALVFCANPGRNAARYGARGRELYALQDATIASTFAMLAATALGLASVWIGAFDDDDVKRIVGASRHEQPVAILALGAAGETPERPPRRALADLIHDMPPPGDQRVRRSISSMPDSRIRRR